MSARVTVRSSITKPPWSIRLWAMNWRMKSATAGPGQATQPFAHQEAALALARQQRLAVVELAHEVDLLAQRLDRIEQAKAGPAHPCGDRGAPEHTGEQAGGGLGDLLGDPERQRAAGIDRAAEGDHGLDPFAAQVGRRLVAEHPTLRVAAQVDVAPGRPADPLDRVGDRDHVVGEVALEPSLLALGSAEVDDPGVGSVLVQDRDRARGRRDVVDVGREHQRRHQDQRRTDGLVGVVAPQPVDRPLGDDLERRRLLVGLQATESRHLERVLRRGADPRRRLRDRLRDQVDPRTLPGIRATTALRILSRARGSRAPRRRRGDRPGRGSRP